MLWPRDSRRLAQTCLVAGALALSAYLLCLHWDPWYCERVLAHDGAVIRAAFTPDNEKVVTLSGSVVDGEPIAFRCWEVRTGKEQSHVPDDIKAKLVGRNPNGRTIVLPFLAKPTSRETSPVIEGSGLFSVSEKRYEVMLKDSKGLSLTSTTFSSDGKMVAAGTDKGEVRIWDAADGTRLVAASGHRGPVISCAFSHDGDRLATGGDDGAIYIWGVRDGRRLACLSGNADRVLSITFSPTDEQIATTGKDLSVRIWDVDSGKQAAVMLGHGEPCSWVTFSPDGAHLVTASWDKTARIWCRRRPERWWGIPRLIEFWATVFFGGLFVWSLWHDRKYFKSLDARLAAERAAKAARGGVDGGPGGPDAP